MSDCACEEHELPAVEAVLAGTLALMTGYSQALLAELHPEQRVLMGRKIGNNLALLAEHPQLSTTFQALLGGLQRRWAQMAGCTAEAAPARHATLGRDGAAALPHPAVDAHRPAHLPPTSPTLAATLERRNPRKEVVCEAPRRLQ